MVLREIPQMYTTRISFWHTARRISQRELARRTGISEKTIERLDQGRSPNPSIRHLLAIAHVLRVPLEELIEEDWRLFQLGGRTFRAEPPEAPDPTQLDLVKAREAGERQSSGPAGMS